MIELTGPVSKAIRRYAVLCHGLALHNQHSLHIHEHIYQPSLLAQITHDKNGRLCGRTHRRSALPPLCSRLQNRSGIRALDGSSHPERLWYLVPCNHGPPRDVSDQWDDSRGELAASFHVQMGHHTEVFVSARGNSLRRVHLSNRDRIAHVSARTPHVGRTAPKHEALTDTHFRMTTSAAMLCGMQIITYSLHLRPFKSSPVGRIFLPALLLPKRQHL